MRGLKVKPESSSLMEVIENIYQEFETEIETGLMELAYSRGKIFSSSRRYPLFFYDLEKEIIYLKYDQNALKYPHKKVDYGRINVFYVRESLEEDFRNFGKKVSSRLKEEYLREPLVLVVKTPLKEKLIMSLV